MMQDKLSPSPTKAERIARRLAEEIAQGHLPPGTSLDETTIAARFGVSRTPIREAIRQLTASGILESRAHRGAVVRDFSEKQLDDMFAVMAELEALCARWAALAMTTAERRALQAIHEEAAAAVAGNDHLAYATLNQRFHTACYLGAHNEHLAVLAEDIRIKLAPFRRAQFAASGRLAASHAEHANVVEAVMRKDAVLAYDTMRAHLVRVRTVVDDVAGNLDFTTASRRD
jgi:DNA-binding GntR family transcriptional regulator